MEWRFILFPWQSPKISEFYTIAKLSSVCIRKRTSETSLFFIKDKFIKRIYKFPAEKHIYVVGKGNYINPPWNYALRMIKFIFTKCLFCNYSLKPTECVIPNLLIIYLYLEFIFLSAVLKVRKMQEVNSNRRQIFLTDWLLINSV